MILNLGEVSTKQIAELFKRGLIGIFPTDTVYGIGCLPRIETLNRFYQIKKRANDKPTAVLVGSLKQIKTLAVIDERADKIIKKFWPGDLTLVLQAKARLDPRIVYNGFIGVRFPSNRFLQEVLEKTGPLVVSSANFQHLEPPYTFREIEKGIIGLVDFVLRSDSERLKVPSTVVKIEEEQITLLRQGRISKDDLDQI